MSTSSREQFEDEGQKREIQEDLRSMSFQELMQLKEELGSKIYTEAVFGEARDRKKKANLNFKRLNKNRPREQSSKYQTPFLGSEERSQKKLQALHRDPRFDENSGTYDPKSFKDNYKFLTNIRRTEIIQLKKQLKETQNDEQRKTIKHSMQRLANKNVEEKNWHEKQAVLKKEQMEIQIAKSEGRTPHFMTKKERRAKELVQKFEDLKRKGTLPKHMEKRRKKNAAKDRKKLCFE